jgi:hypothetical protein
LVFCAKLLLFCANTRHQNSASACRYRPRRVIWHPEKESGYRRIGIAAMSSPVASSRDAAGFAALQVR